MRKIKEVIIVEGKHDIDFLETFLDADFIKTDGTSLPQETKELIKSCNDRGIIILTDPDHPGEYIRQEVSKLCSNVKHAFVRAKNSRYKKKVGVEHTTKEEVYEALDNMITYTESNDKISMQDLVDLGLMGQDNSSKLRYEIQQKLHLGKGSAKTFLKRINMLNITPEQLKNEVDKL